MHSLEFAAGLILVLLVFVDVFATVLVPRPSRRGARMGPLLATVLAQPWRQLVVRFKSRGCARIFAARLHH